MGLTEILQAMERKTDLEIVGLESSADEECRSIIAGAEEEATRIKEKYRADAEERLRREQERLFSAGKLDRQRKLAAARESWLDQVAARTRLELGGLRDGGNYAQGLERLTHEALAEIGAPAKLEIDPQDETFMRRIMAALGVDGKIVATLNTAGGLRASSLDGCITVDNRVEARLENAWSDLRQRLAALLTAEEVSCLTTTATPTRASAP